MIIKGDYLSEELDEIAEAVLGGVVVERSLQDMCNSGFNFK